MSWIKWQEKSYHLVKNGVVLSKKANVIKLTKYV